MPFARELATPDLCEELFPLLRLHYEEIAHFKDIPLAPDFDLYQRLEKAGDLRVFTARSDEKVLIGYAIFFVRKNPHYSTSLQAVQDVVFIHPAHRGTGARLLMWCDAQLMNEGVEVVMHHVKVAHPQLGVVLERMGYQHVDSIYARRL